MAKHTQTIRWHSAVCILHNVKTCSKTLKKNSTEVVKIIIFKSPKTCLKLIANTQKMSVDRLEKQLLIVRNTVNSLITGYSKKRTPQFNAQIPLHRQKHGQNLTRIFLNSGRSTSGHFFIHETIFHLKISF